MLLLQCHCGKVQIILTFCITREKQPDRIQGACINITTISVIEIWSTYIKTIFKCNCAKFTHSPLCPVSMLLYRSEKLAQSLKTIAITVPLKLLPSQTKLERAKEEYVICPIGPIIMSLYPTNCKHMFLI